MYQATFQPKEEVFFFILWTGLNLPACDWLSMFPCERDLTCLALDCVMITRWIRLETPKLCLFRGISGFFQMRRGWPFFPLSFFKNILDAVIKTKMTIISHLNVWNWSLISFRAWKHLEGFLNLCQETDSSVPRSHHF